MHDNHRTRSRGRQSAPFILLQGSLESPLGVTIGKSSDYRFSPIRARSWFVDDFTIRKTIFGKEKAKPLTTLLSISCPAPLGAGAVGSLSTWNRSDLKRSPILDRFLTDFPAPNSLWCSVPP
jgi:hypothetical protein